MEKFRYSGKFFFIASVMVFIVQTTPAVCPIYWINFKSGQGDEAADSTDSTEPIHLVLQHLRESFSLS